jgi:hypothetical protein
MTNLSLQLKAREFKAYLLFIVVVVVMLPEVGVSSFMKESSPRIIVDTDQFGFQSSG